MPMSCGRAPLAEICAGSADADADAETSPRAGAAATVGAGTGGDSDGGANAGVGAVTNPVLMPATPVLIVDDSEMTDTPTPSPVPCGGGGAGTDEFANTGLEAFTPGAPTIGGAVLSLPAWVSVTVTVCVCVTVSRTVVACSTVIVEARQVDVCAAGGGGGGGGGDAAGGDGDAAGGGGGGADPGGGGGDATDTDDNVVTVIMLTPELAMSDVAAASAVTVCVTVTGLAAVTLADDAAAEQAVSWVWHSATAKSGPAAAEHDVNWMLHAADAACPSAVKAWPPITKDPLPLGLLVTGGTAPPSEDPKTKKVVVDWTIIMVVDEPPLASTVAVSVAVETSSTVCVAMLMKVVPPTVSVAVESSSTVFTMVWLTRLVTMLVAVWFIRANGAATVELARAVVLLDRPFVLVTVCVLSFDFDFDFVVRLLVDLTMVWWEVDFKAAGPFEASPSVAFARPGFAIPGAAGAGVTVLGAPMVAAEGAFSAGAGAIAVLAPSPNTKRRTAQSWRVDGNMIGRRTKKDYRKACMYGFMYVQVKERSRCAGI